MHMLRNKKDRGTELTVEADARVKETKKKALESRVGDRKGKTDHL